MIESLVLTHIRVFGPIWEPYTVLWFEHVRNLFEEYNLFLFLHWEYQKCVKTDDLW
jgi:hypothetical protein